MKAEPAPAAQSSEKPSPELACDLSALDDPEAHQRIARPLFEGAEAIEELDDGFALRYAPAEGLVRRIGQFIEGERQCCPFFRFELEVAPHGGPVWLRLRGSDAVKEFLGTELDSRNLT